MAGGLTVKSPDLHAWASDLRRIDPRVKREMARAHKEVSVDVARKASGKVAGIRDAGGRGAAGIQARPEQDKGVLALLGSNQFVRAAVFGAETHWIFGRPMPASQMTRRVWQPWVGNDWTPEEGLYGVSPAIREAMPSIIDTYGDRMMDALAQAFPEGG